MRQIALFLLVGGFAALTNFLSRIGFIHFLSYVPAIVLAYCVGMVTAFVLNRLFVFTSATNRPREQALWSVVIKLAAVLQTIAVSVLRSRWLLPLAGIEWHRETFAHIVGVLVPVAPSYFGHKQLSFRSTSRMGIAP